VLDGAAKGFKAEEKGADCTVSVCDEWSGALEALEALE
jgi:hypothetical protein